MKALRHRLHRARIWVLRVLVSWLLLTGFVPRPMYLVFLQWLREEMDPLHPELDTVLVEIAQLERPA